ncbi:TPA: hypothetical protein TUU08_000153 [Streptococcus equi subsp. zooepidemicus]|nr:hypothetical protein Javan191_0012 [Streptococcus phage Javan191]HEK9982050.1 hypothetical protein [Streptococcus equi subsp. zooepidemicus]HEL0196405.1 hypothetical protein [Streptococcus equi subsp. zooepidemicus]HEL0205899.1 hypothetical protein [Streptococcus equi subsp. zooepidemicus]HEL0531593.1 hypothetical protein [Streptococcus equi subsp. zooepidemicus]
MIARNERKIDVYENAGAYMRLLKTVGTKVVVAISPVLHAKDTDRLLNAFKVIDEICSKADSNMFYDHINLGNEYVDVFYGDLASEPRNDVDEKIITMAKERAVELFKRK